MLFWTELKLIQMKVHDIYGFRVVLFWTELKLLDGTARDARCFRVVLFWTELKPASIPHQSAPVLELCYFGLN